MSTEVEKDALTGKTTTGHEWDGIKELNTPLPKWWLYVLYATIAWSALWWLLYPSWPWLTGYFGGILGANQRLELVERMAVAEATQAQYLERIAAASLDQIAQDPDLANFALVGGAAAFADNCAPCHGLGGAGQGFYPNLADDAWIWGGTLDEIHTTILYGVRSDHEQTRFNEMPAFGPLEMLSRSDIGDVAEHVLALSGRSEDPEAAARGAGLYAEQCVACHGGQGEGMPELGAPALDDGIWQYGGTKAEIVAQIHSPRHGIMPAWVGRLEPETIKILAAYVHSLGGGQKARRRGPTDTGAR